MPAHSPTGLANRHSSPWVRFVIRTLSIRGAGWWVLVLSLSATLVVCRQAWQSEGNSRKLQFESDAAVLHAAVNDRLNRYVQMLQGVRGLFAASDSVEESEFSAYVSSLDYHRDYPGIVTMGYLQWVGQEQAPNDMVLHYEEFPGANRMFPGFKPGSDPAQREAAEKARDTATPRLSRKTALTPDSDATGAILYVPIYRNGSSSNTPAERKSNLQGWAYMAFHAANLMNAARQTTGRRLDYEVFDGGQPTPDNILCRSGQAGKSPSPERFSQETTVPVFGQLWTLRLRAPDGAVAGLNPLPVELLAGGGIAISLLLFGIARSMATTGQRACALAVNMTSEINAQKEALRKSEERLQLVIEGSNDGVWDWNVESNDVYFSPRWKSMLGYEDHEIENTFSSWDRLLHPEDREHALQVLKQYMANETSTYQVEHRMRHKDGSYRWILSRGVALRDVHGHPVRMAGSHVDLTELKRVEQELLATNRELCHSQAHLKSVLADLSASHAQIEKTQLELIQAAKLESVGTLAAGVAHEVKNPLQIILMGLDYLDQRFAGIEEDTVVTLQDMRDAALRADSITRELLKFSTSTEFRPVPADIEEVLERSLWLLRTDLNRAGVTLVKNLAETLPPVLIDTAKIQQVLINLVNNALQAMNYSGTVTITTTVDRLDCVLPPRLHSHCPLDPAEEAVILKVGDSGPGIPEELLLRIFDPFFTTKTVGSGSGLGLSVVKKIMELHGGCIHIQNSPHGGAEVILAFAVALKTSTPPAGNVLRV